MPKNIYRPRLRILLDPIYVQIANLSGSSTYHKYVTLARELVSRGHFVYWMVPDAEYVPDDMEDHPNVAIIRTERIQDQFVIDGLVTDKFFNLFNRIAGKYHIDVLCTSRTSLALYYKRLLEPPRFHDNGADYTDKAYGLPVIVIEEFPQTRKRQHSGKAYWLMQCQGYLGADLTVFLSEHNRDEVTTEMMDWFRTSVVNSWCDKTSIITSGIECDELDQYYDEDRWRHEEGFQVLSIGRLFGVSYVEFLPWFEYLFKSGLDETCLHIALSGKLSGPMRHKLEGVGFDFANVGKQFKIHENNPRKNFLRMLKRFHCFIVPVSHLDHPTGILEALYLGLPGILPESDYQQTFFADYPFVINPKKKNELIGSLEYIRENPQRARDMIKPWRDEIREKHNAPHNIGILCNNIENVSRSTINRFKTSKGVINLLRELDGKSYKFDDVIAYLKKSGRMGVSVGNMKVRATFTYGRSSIHHAMGLVGYVDDCKKTTERFIRKDIFDKRNRKVK